jgi:hypothetical protein
MILWVWHGGSERVALPKPAMDPIQPISYVEIQVKGAVTRISHVYRNESHQEFSAHESYLCTLGFLASSYLDPICFNVQQW